ncbi:DUF5666 domain-containing protein [Actimicrobium sp. CCC2.4]|uniref:DUF5666 domain-containing protein n=1 Tax=Actimicrobium sp. CCC2.4 TaxID=3048606 RepID=UPI002AC9AF98|nr:DUF5666 domain-containing protein [Actimicrobium sp. CCC2.4]MEB0134914.1 DUF5666 domain-containing protein [Actimicrobium sp. CCC2.4]WPX32034.1 DUF5666 domain-containing protein [Actimicrobium sp. CCC2.4]
MKTTRSTLYWQLMALAGTALLAACGGGGSTSVTPPTTPTTQTSAGTSVYVGPIGGFGSVIVNGMRFSSVGATLVDDDANTINLDQLKLGMTVRVTGDTNDTTQTGTASRLELVHGTRGTLSAIDVNAGTLVVMGQRIVTSTATSYQGVSGLAALTAGQAVEIYGALQADGSLLATLIEAKTALTSVNLTGRVAALGATTFQVGSLTVNFSAATVNGVLADGKRVKVRATAAPVGNVLTASSVKVFDNSAVFGSTVTSGVRLKLKGVADTSPLNGLLTVSGTQVNITNAIIKGATTTVVAGQFLEVKGVWDGSVLQASEVEQEGFRESQIGGRNELYGTVNSINGSTAIVNGVTVDLSAAVFQHGNLQLVTVGSYVEIKGNMRGSLLVATRIELKTNSTAKDIVYEQSGVIQGFTSVAGFKLNGLQIDASQAVFERGAATGLANGIYIEIKGAQNSSGVFVATKVEIKTASPG